MRTTVTADDSITSGLQDLYVRHAPAALRLAYFLSGDRETARDLVQDAFVRVAGRLRHLREPDEFDAYLRRTIVNIHTSRLRRPKWSGRFWPARLPCRRRPRSRRAATRSATMRNEVDRQREGLNGCTRRSQRIPRPAG
jgi:RNA polymerase sigma factor (sigma-70 family)